jgi:hypothetical protein
MKSLLVIAKSTSYVEEPLLRYIYRIKKLKVNLYSCIDIVTVPKEMHKTHV